MSWRIEGVVKPIESATDPNRRLAQAMRTRFAARFNAWVSIGTGVNVTGHTVARTTRFELRFHALVDADPNWADWKDATETLFKNDSLRGSVELATIEDEPRPWMSTGAGPSKFIHKRVVPKPTTDVIEESPRSITRGGGGPV